jgi:Phosphodiesterase/alkaline phosphatase D
VLLGVAVYQFIRGAKKKFLDDAKTEEIPRTIEPTYSLLGTVGHIARAIVFGLVGVFLVKAAYDYRRRTKRSAWTGRSRSSTTAQAGRGYSARSPRACSPLRVSPSSKRATGGSRHNGDGEAHSELVLGPLLRYAGSESATFWVETDAACEVEILGHRTTTFTVEGHHYALLLVDDLEPGSVSPYDVRLDGEQVWPPDDGRPGPAVHTRDHEPRVRLVFGSCRVGDPQPIHLGETWPDDVKALGIDALWTYSKQLQRGELEWPDAVLLLGDQVYADDVSPGTLEFIERRRGTDVEPGKQIADFEEYTQLYRESWSEPDIRWLLSTVPTTMIFDDHDVNDDWNISWRWVEEMRAKPWWEARITGASWRTGSTSISATSRRPSSTQRRPSPACRPRPTPALSSAGSPTSGTGSRLRAVGPSTGTSATPACSSSTRGRLASSRTAAGR